LSDEPIPLSALQHWSYCPRQCALIHLEQVFEENVHTMRGHAAHARIDEPGFETTPGARVERALPVWSDRLGLVGRCDAVEYRADGTVYPVEFKHGPRRTREHDDIQLAAQAVCLEEMTQRPVRRGAIFHVSSRRRREVSIDAALRSRMERVLRDVRATLAGGTVPSPANDRRCTECSLRTVCQPEVIGGTARIRSALRSLFEPDPGPTAQSNAQCGSERNA
jgi:CRISPR-associated exonuclease Cas4